MVGGVLLSDILFFVLSLFYFLSGTLSFEALL